MTELSANEVETLVLKAARGGGCPMGLAEDLAAAAAYVDLNALTRCPCDSGAVQGIPAALDAVLAGQGAATVAAEVPLVRGYVAARAGQGDPAVAITETAEGVELSAATSPTDTVPAFGRRVLRPDLLAHLQEMAAKTLVPETEASRTAGAGAGLTDND